MADTELSAIATKITALVKAVRYYISDGTNVNKYSDLEQLASWLSSFRMARIAADRTLTSTTSEQTIFDAANDTLTLPTGTYLIDGVISLSTMSATSGNASFRLVGAGTAVTANVLIDNIGIDGNTATIGTRTGSTQITNNSPTSAVTAGTSTSMQLRIKGCFEVTAAGTLIPSLALVTANAAVVKAGSHLRFTRVGDTGFQASEDWA